MAALTFIVKAAQVPESSPKWVAPIRIRVQPDASVDDVRKLVYSEIQRSWTPFPDWVTEETLRLRIGRERLCAGSGEAALNDQRFMREIKRNKFPAPYSGVIYITNMTVDTGQGCA
jgi:hypothetical protein